MAAKGAVLKRAVALQATAIVIAMLSTSAAAQAATSSSAVGATLPSTTATAGTAASEDLPNDDAHWWKRHYKWVIMLIALFVGLTLFALLATWLKRRYERRADQIRDGFNAGITTRSNPKLVGEANGPGGPYAQRTTTDLEPGNGRNSPARSRNAFMPYGYGYSHSESRLATPPPEGMVEMRRSPLARVQTLRDDDEIQKIGPRSTVQQMEQTGSPEWGKGKVLVRERVGGE